MKRLGQTHLSHILTLTLTYFVSYPFLLPSSVETSGPSAKLSFLFSPLPSHMQPHFPFSRHSPPMLPSHWYTVNPIAWHLCRVCKGQNLWEASCWLLNCRFWGLLGPRKMCADKFLFLCKWVECEGQGNSLCRRLRDKVKRDKKKEKWCSTCWEYILKFLTISLENWQKKKKNEWASTTSVYGFISTGSGGVAVVFGRQVVSTQQLQWQEAAR